MGRTLSLEIHIRIYIHTYMHTCRTSMGQTLALENYGMNLEYKHIHTHTHTHIHTYIHTYIHIYLQDEYGANSSARELWNDGLHPSYSDVVSLCVCVYVVPVCVYVCMCVGLCMYICVCMCGCTYIHEELWNDGLHLHTHTENILRTKQVLHTHKTHGWNHIT